MKVYLAGPMRGYADFNFPAFFCAAEKLREAGYEVFSSAEADIKNGFDPVGQGITAEIERQGFSERELLAADLDWVCREAEMVVVLPGWERSAGANAEVSVARALEIDVLTLAEALAQPG
jgi:Domain of unknown function (DUF4406)